MTSLSSGLDPVAQPGVVYLVGAGPGDPGLITVRGLRLLQQADAVVFDRLSPPELLDAAPSTAERLYVGKTHNEDAVAEQETINELLIGRARSGQRVVRLKGGDPFVFGRGGEEALALRAAGVLCEVVPGVTSAIAVPAAAGIPITHQQLSRSFVVVTGQTRQQEAIPHNGHDEGEGSLAHIDFAALAAIDTVIVLMGVQRLSQLAARLLAAGRPAETPVAIIERGTTSVERVVVGRLDDIGERASAAGVRAPAVIVIGNVVALYPALAPHSTHGRQRLPQSAPSP